MLSTAARAVLREPRAFAIGSETVFSLGADRPAVRGGDLKAGPSTRDRSGGIQFEGGLQRVLDK